MKKYPSLFLSSSFLLISTSAHSMYQTPLDEYNYEGRNGQKVMLITPGNNASSVTWNYQGYSFYDHNNPDESFDIVNLTNKIDLKSPDKKANYYKAYLQPVVVGEPYEDSIELIDYSPITTGVTNSFSSGSNWGVNVNANVGAFGPVPTVGIGGGFDYGQNKGVSQTLPPIQILAKKGVKDIAWEFRVQGAVEPSYDFSIEVNSTWKISSKMRDVESRYLYGIPFQCKFSYGKFELQVIDDAEKVLPEPTSFLQFMSMSLPFGMIGELSGLLLGKNKDAKVDYTIRVNVEKATDYRKSNDPLPLFPVPLPLRENSWFLIHNQIVAPTIICADYQYPSIVQKGALLYGMYNVKSLETAVKFPRFIYSSDGIHWRPSKSRLPDDFNSADNYGSGLVYDGTNLMFVSRQTDSTTRLFVLEDGLQEWTSLKLPPYIKMLNEKNEKNFDLNDARGPNLAIFKNKLHIAYVQQEEGNLKPWPCITVNLGGENFTAPRGIVAFPARGRIALASSKDRLFASFRYFHSENNYQKLGFAWSDDGYWNWNFKELSYLSATDPSLLIKGDILYLITQVTSIPLQASSTIRMSRYSLKTNKWDPHISVFDTSKLPYPISMPENDSSGFGINSFSGGDFDESKIYIFSRNSKEIQGQERGYFVTTFLGNETQYKKYQP